MSFFSPFTRQILRLAATLAAKPSRSSSLLGKSVRLRGAEFANREMTCIRRSRRIRTFSGSQGLFALQLLLLHEAVEGALGEAEPRVLVAEELRIVGVDLLPLRIAVVQLAVDLLCRLERG